MKVAYFDCIAGASGDMILGALVDAGLSKDILTDRLTALNLKDFKLEFNRVKKNGFSATKVDVLVQEKVPARHLREIKRIIDESNLDEKIRVKAIAIIHRLGEVEAGIHGAELEKVHLHELGGVDTIVDIVGTIVGLEELEIERIYASPLPLGRGFIKGAHGQIPLPAPATIALLKDVPIKGIDLEFETVTPTGAVLLSSLAHSFGNIPKMTINAIGYGAGSRDLPLPNILRLLIGEQYEDGKETITETLIKLETNIDDMNPEIFDYVMAKLFDAGALDVYLTPLQMKKNRPATMLSVLCQPNDLDNMKAIIFSETSTLGVRIQSLQRDCLPRKIEKVTTAYGEIQVKVAQLPEGKTKVFPEYEDCRKLAQELDVPLWEVYQTALYSMAKK